MKKFAAVALATALTATMTMPASALTPGIWDFSGIPGLVSGVVKEEQSKTEHTIVYDMNGGFLWEFFASASYQRKLEMTGKGTHTVVDMAPFRPLMQFVGWEYDGEIYHAGDTIPLTEDVTFTAVWEK